MQATDELIGHVRERGTNAIVCLDIDYESIDRGKNNGSGMLLVSISGTLLRV